ncbi:hypothetical protein [Pseudomonas oryzihabitans]|uniref:hypothetical protein n=1 Tax=Pseudomonas oryzihabitans TaxID=47885 RepID=UPI0021DB4FC0|nr:hypothetical protein [Pseudomonas oryzihabitans]
MADSNISIGKVISTSSNFVDKAVEFRHFMLLISFLLALDSCLMIFYKKNLLQSFDHLSAPEVSAPGALIFLGIFAFLMALFFPVLRHLLLAATTWIRFYYPIKEEGSSNDFRYPSLARREALIKRDKLIIELLEKQEEQKVNHETNMNIGFGLAVMFAIDYSALGNDEILTLAQTAAALPDLISGFWISLLIRIAFGVFIIFLLVIFAMSLTPDTDQKLYLPEPNIETTMRTETEKN